MKTYTIIAIYADNEQRYATSLEADSPEQAEKEAQAVCLRDNKWEDHEDKEPLIIAGVIEGEVNVVA